MHIDAVRRFNRFYTRRIGVLRAGLLGSPYRLAEARLLYELAQGGQATASALGRDLGLDLGYLSRLLQGLKRRGLVRARRAAHDGRPSLLGLTAQGRAVLVVKQSRSVAQLRLLIVEPSARGRGLGRRLVEECIAFARAKGYRRLVLWTQSNLAAARALYWRCGFRRVRKERHSSFGYDLVGEFWQLAL